LEDDKRVEAMKPFLEKRTPEFQGQDSASRRSRTEERGESG